MDFYKNAFFFLLITIFCSVANAKNIIRDGEFIGASETINIDDDVAQEKILVEKIGKSDWQCSHKITLYKAGKKTKENVFKLHCNFGHALKIEKDFTNGLSPAAKLLKVKFTAERCGNPNGAEVFFNLQSDGTIEKVLELGLASEAGIFRLNYKYIFPVSQADFPYLDNERNNILAVYTVVHHFNDRKNAYEIMKKSKSEYIWNGKNFSKTDEK